VREAYSKIVSGLTGISQDKRLGPLMALGPRAVSYVNEFREDAHILQILRWLSLPDLIVPYDRNTRQIGTSSYSIAKRIKHALRGFAFATSRFMAVMFTASFFVAAMTTLAVIYFVFRFAQGNPPSGWLSLMSVTALGLSLVSMLLSIIGGLLIEILNVARKRPLVVIADGWQSEHEQR
jgi:dolichol-phosphate mannosyltransferase